MLLKKSVLAAVAVATLTVSAAFATVPAQTNACNYQFATNLRLGAVSSDVQNLQKLLNMDAATRVAVSGAGSMGSETFRFGPATLAAVKKFQAANGISPVSGYVGPLTRGVLNTICSSTVSTTPTTNTGSGVVSNNIPVSVLVMKQSSAKLAEFVVSGNGMVTGIELMRTGLSNNATLENVYLYDGATRITDGSSVMTDGTIRFTSSAGLFPVSGSKTITVRADIADSTSGQTVGVAMKSVTMMGGTATPVTGANGPLFSISSAQLIVANLTQRTTSSTEVPSDNTSINPGTQNFTVWKDQLNISNNPAKFHGITFKMVGGAPSNALSNVKLFVGGVERGSATINSMNQFVFDMSANPVLLNTGSYNIELRADIVGGAGRSFYVVLERPTDIRVEDVSLPGVFVTVLRNSTAGSFFNLKGGDMTIASVLAGTGALNVVQDTSFNNTTTLVSGATNVKLAAWKFTSFGEDIKVLSIKFLPSFTNGASTTLKNVGLYVNGGQVGSNKTSVTHNDNTTATFNSLGTNLYVASGQTVTVEVKGDVVNSSGQNVLAGDIKFTIDESEYQGIASGDVKTDTTDYSGQTLSIASSNGTLSQTAGFSGGTISPNATMVKIGSFAFQTGNAEAVSVNQIKVTASGTAPTANQITNILVKEGSTQIGNAVGNPGTNVNNITPSTTLNVPANTLKIFDVYANVASNASGNLVSVNMTVEYTGNVSGQTKETSSVLGSTLSVAVPVLNTSSLTFTQSSSPVAQFVVAGQTNFTIGNFNAKSSNSVAGAVLKDITFAASSSVAYVTVNGKKAQVTSGYATVTDVMVTVPGDLSGINVPVQVDLVCINTNGCSGSSTAVVQLIPTYVTYSNGVQVATTTITSAGTPAHSLVGSKPSVTFAQSSTAGLTNGNVLLGTITVAADAAGDIELSALPFNFASTTGVTISNLLLRDSSGSTQIVGPSSTNGTSSPTIANTAGVNSATFLFSTARKITKGTYETYTVYGTVTGVSGNAGTVSVSASLGDAVKFLWSDLLGGSAAAGITGASIYNYPTNTQTKTN